MASEIEIVQPIKCSRIETLSPDFEVIQCNEWLFDWINRISELFGC